MRPAHSINQGSVLLMILVMMGVFMVMFLAGAQLIATQSRQTVNQSEQEVSFQVAEAGAHYAEWLLNVAGRTPAQLVASPPAPQTLTNPTTQKTLGQFTLTFTSAASQGTTTVTATSVGQDTNHPTLKQTVVVQFVSTDGTVYTQTSWDHRL